MPAADDISLDEKRVFRASGSDTTVYVGSDLGLTRVAVSGAQVGRQELVHQESIHDLAGAAGQLAVASETDVYVGRETLEATAFGPATAVSLVDGAVIAATADGKVARRTNRTWEPIGTIPEIRAMDERLVAAAGGVYSVRDEAVHLGLDDANDVASVGPYAATAGGLYGRQDGWTELVDGSFTVVGGAGTVAHAVGGTLWTLRAGAWTTSQPDIDEPIVDVAYGGEPYAVTADGQLIVDLRAYPDRNRDWAYHHLGIGKPSGVAVPGSGG